MASTTYAIIATRKQTIDGIEYLKDDVVTTVLWDGKSEYEAGAYQRLELIKPGWTVIDGKLAELPPAPPAGTAAPIRVIRSLAFRDRLAQAKQEAISVAAMQAATAGDGALLTFMLNQAAAAETNLDDPRVQLGINALRGAGLITQAEATALRADGTPDEAA
ncbi:hypothetical protein EAH89_17330 [Roseomonas nepalensis]|uniref:DUF4376 domain-containing protein n=1 Tax=Muricoccus nepalensis TaxID=1854500 RepID=A0A502FV68_9PROT|nr:hypothetical protein [Roseomonas nepalensis]TPG53280.1 hypothetical protein EAH89_17330 [Roseomonas nepalensis]